MRPGRFATSLAAMWAKSVVYIAVASRQDPVDKTIQDARRFWQAKVKPR